MNQEGSATLSICGRYRYELTRVLTPRPNGVVVFIGVNPSVADATTDDPTIRKMVGFTQRWGYGIARVGNLFAYRSPDVQELGRVDEPVGRDNDAHLSRLFEQANLVVPCWGAAGKLPRSLRGRIAEISAMLKQLDAFTPVKCLGKTGCGNPRHPLMPAYTTPLEDWQ